MSFDGRISAGSATPLGATADAHGVNFAVFSANATQMLVCLFDATGAEHQVPLPERTGDIWHGHIAGIAPGQHYGLRARGPYEPEVGHRFNPHKLLMDPYARRVTGHPVWDDALMGYTVGAKKADLTFDTRDSARVMPRCVVEAPCAPFDMSIKPRTAPEDTIVYEAHTKGLTMQMPNVSAPGTYAALASEPVIEHLTNLGVTALELLPVHAFLNDRFLVEKGLTNYWGYQSIGFFAPEPRYMSGDDIGEFQTMVAALNRAGIEVILDVVYNHTGEGDQTGPTLGFRGLDNASYYRLLDDPRYYVNDTGTGNTLRTDYPAVLRMVMDSLRYWVEVMGVDGFRFDLCATLGRRADGFDRDAPLFQAMRQDPVLSRVKLIAEPWDIGPGGYQLGAFRSPFQEWNAKFRDDVSRFWRGDAGSAANFAGRVMGSALQFDHSGRRATSSVNMLTAHDGFTLRDVVSYVEKHNMANGEEGRDGHSDNASDNLGIEGETDDVGILAARSRRQRAMLASLFLAQGMPMLLAGDEIGNSQGGNNNAYNQDNPTSWLDWSQTDHTLLDFTKQLIAFRKRHPILRQSRFLHSRERLVDGVQDLFWRRADGAEMSSDDWSDPTLGLVTAELRMACDTPPYAAREDALFLVFNTGPQTTVVLSEPPDGMEWRLEIDSAKPDHQGGSVRNQVTIGEQSVSVYALASRKR